MYNNRIWKLIEYISTISNMIVYYAIDNLIYYGIYINNLTNLLNQFNKFILLDKLMASTFRRLLDKIQQRKLFFLAP